MSNPVSFSYEDVGRRRAQLTIVPLTLDISGWDREMLPSHAVVFDQFSFLLVTQPPGALPAFQDLQGTYIRVSSLPIEELLYQYPEPR
jgi:hypothetical protein